MTMGELIEEEPIPTIGPVEVLKCDDCGEVYRDFGLECVIVTAEHESRILPEVGEIVVCASCIAKRAEKIGYKVMRIEFE